MVASLPWRNEVLDKLDRQGRDECIRLEWSLSLVDVVYPKRPLGAPFCDVPEVVLDFVALDVKTDFFKRLDFLSITTLVDSQCVEAVLVVAVQFVSDLLLFIFFDRLLGLVENSIDQIQAQVRETILYDLLFSIWFLGHHGWYVRNLCIDDAFHPLVIFQSYSDALAVSVIDYLHRV